MILTLQRRETVGEAIFGDVLIDGIHECLSLERHGVEIPTGVYPVALTTSRRARKGELWSPRTDHGLLLVQDVAGRSGIRIHSGNTPEQTEGCILVGTVRLSQSIQNSRTALKALMDKVGSKPCTLRVEDVA